MCRCVYRLTCVCSVCKEEKDNREFYWYHDRKKKLNGTGRIRINTNCSSCISRISREYNKLKREIIKTHPVPDYGSPCDLCGKPVYKSREDIPAGVDGKCTWQCDHDHDSVDFRVGYVRIVTWDLENLVTQLMH